MKKHPQSHMDHGFTQAQWDHIFAKYADKTAFFIDTFELPEELGTVPQDLYGPSCGDPPVEERDVHYAKRGTRTCDSRLVSWPKRATRFVRVIAGPYDGHACILYTAYGVASIDMPAAPKEVGDLAAQIDAFPETSTQEGLEQLARLKAQHSEAEIFWRSHGLADA